MAGPFDPQEEDPLQAALSSAFTQPLNLPSPSSSTSDVKAPSSSSAPAPPDPAPSAPTAPESASEGDGEDWKGEYDARLSQWRAESAKARQKAEETRAMYESIRAEEQKEEESRAKEKKMKEKESDDGEAHGGGVRSSDWENVEASTTATTIMTTTTEDTSDLRASTERVPLPGPSPPASVSFPSDPEDAHSRWEEIPSVASSFPSLDSGTSPQIQSSKAQKPTPSPENKSAGTTTKTAATSTSAMKSGGEPTKRSSKGGAVATRPSVTPIIFRSDVPAKTRAWALLSSLAINMFLPFVNGVMLGFGEIFARNVVGPWFGWKPVPALAAAKPKPSSNTFLRGDEVEELRLEREKARSRWAW